MRDKTCSCRVVYMGQTIPYVYCPITLTCPACSGLGVHVNATHGRRTVGRCGIGRSMQFVFQAPTSIRAWEANCHRFLLGAALR